MTSLVWLRDDLRLDDQPAIRAAAADPALFVYRPRREIRRRVRSAARAAGGSTSRCARSPSRSNKIGGRLDVVRGEAETIIPALARHADAVYWTRRYGGAEVETDTRIKAELCARASRPSRASTASCCASPGRSTTDAGAPFKVFTPFWRR